MNENQKQHDPNSFTQSHLEFVAPTGLEPVFKVQETFVLSLELQGRLTYRDKDATKIVKIYYGAKQFQTSLPDHSDEPYMSPESYR